MTLRRDRRRGQKKYRASVSPATIGRVWRGGCPNCGHPGPHFIPPSFGDPGFFTCDRPGMPTSDGLPIFGVTRGNALLLSVRDVSDSYERLGLIYPMSGDTRARVLNVMRKLGML